jgi:CRISPR/Cas system CMR subunit Cmr6 (Cas7 group RAMP superfamily)
MSLKLQIEFSSASHHGSGHGLAGLIDRTLLRDHNGNPFLAGSAIKGKLRHAALQLLSSGIPEGAAPPCGTPPCEGDPCLTCLIFGSAWRQGSLVFGDAYPVEGVEGSSQASGYKSSRLN